MITTVLTRLVRRIVLRSVAAGICLTAVAAQGLPETIQYQGYLTDADDQPITGMLRLTFRLYEDPDPLTAPTHLWEEVHDDVPILDGRVALPLGEIAPFEAAGITFDDPLFLELEVGSETLVPRIALQSVPYALKAKGVIPGAIQADMLADEAVTAGKIHLNLAGAGLAVTENGTLKIDTAGITADMLADEAVTAGKVHHSLAGLGLVIGEDGALKIDTAAVTADMIQDAAIANRHIASDANLDPGKIAGTAVTLDGIEILRYKTIDADVNTLLNIGIDEFRPGVIVTTLEDSSKTTLTLPTAAAVKAYVDDRDALAKLADAAITDPAPGQLLITGVDGLWHNRTVAGDLTLDPDGAFTINPDAVTLGTDTTGPYLEGLIAGAGLGGGGVGEALTADLFVNVDGSTIHIVDDALAIAPQGIAAGHLADNIDVSARGFKAYEAVLADKVDGADVDDAATPAADILWTSIRMAEYIDGLFGAFAWQAQVQTFADAVPAEPAAGDRVIADGVPGWNTGSLYTFNGTAWTESVPRPGFSAWIAAEATTYVFDGSNWVMAAQTTDHNALDNLQGGDGGAFYHLGAGLHDALTGLTANRLQSTDADGLPMSTDLSHWIDGTVNQLLVTDEGDGTVTLSLPQDIHPAAMPAFAGISIDGVTVTALSDDPTLAAARSGALPTEFAVKSYVDAMHAAMDSIAELTDTDVAEASAGDLLQFDGASWRAIQQVPGEHIELLPDGALGHGSGLHVIVDGLTLRIMDNALAIADGGVGGTHLADGIDASAKNFIATAAIDADRVDGADVDDDGVPTPTILWSSAKIADFVSGLINGLHWARPVRHFAGAIPPEPETGYRVIADSVEGWNDDSIYEFDGFDWIEFVPTEGMALWVAEKDSNYVYNGSEWVTLGSTQSHAALQGLQGGTPDERYHISRDLYDALTGFAPERLLAADTSGRPVSTALSDWLSGTDRQVAVSPGADGSAVLSLPQDIDTSAHTHFSSVSLTDSLELNDTVVQAISADGGFSSPDHVTLVTQAAIKAYVDALAAAQDTLAELGDTNIDTAAAGDFLQFDGSRWISIPEVPGEFIELQAGGGLTHGSGLMLDLTEDGSLVIAGNQLGVGTIGNAHVGLDAVELGTQTTGDYVAAVVTGDGLLGGSAGEGTIPELTVNIDGVTILFDALGRLQVNGEAVNAGQVDGADVDDAAPAAPNILWSSEKTSTVMAGIVNSLQWQKSVIAITDPGEETPQPGDRYIAPTATKAGATPWTPNSIYEFDGEAWNEMQPDEGTALWVEDEDRHYVFDGAGWTTVTATQNHGDLSGLQGGTPGEYYHLDQGMFDALGALAPERLLATNGQGLPGETLLVSWVRGSSDQVEVSGDSDGGVTIALHDYVPSAAPADNSILMGNGVTWDAVPQTDITRLGTILQGTWQGTPIDGEYISLAEFGGLTHGSGLMINLDPTDASLIIDDDNSLKVNEITGAHVLDGSLSGDDIGNHTIGTAELIGLSDSEAPGQPILADGKGGFQFGNQTALTVAPGTPEWHALREVHGELAEPRGITQDDRGNLYVADAARNRIWILGPYGGHRGWLGKGDDGHIGFHPVGDGASPLAGAEPGAYDQPMDVAFMQSSGANKQSGGRCLWIADAANDRIQLIDLDHPDFLAIPFSATQIDAFGLRTPSGIAVLGSRLFVADTGHHRVVDLEYAGGNLFTLGWYGYDGVTAGFFPSAPQGPPQAGQGDGMFNGPVGLTAQFARSGPVLAVADTGNARVSVFDAYNQTFLGWLGGADDGSTGWHAPGGSASPAPGTEPGEFLQPEGATLRGHYLAVSDAGTDWVSLFTTDFAAVEAEDMPAYVTGFGGSGTAPGQLSHPAGMTPDRDGAIWVCDSNNARIQKFAPPHVDPYAVLEPESGNVVIGGDIPMPSVAFQIESTDGGLLIPRMGPDQMWAIPNPLEGLLVYNYGAELGYKSDPSAKGFFFWDGYGWQRIGEIGYGEVGPDQIAYGAVQSWHIGPEQVGTSQLNTGAVTGVKIAPDTIPDSKLQTISTPDKVAGTAVQRAPGGGLMAAVDGLAVDDAAFVAACPRIVYVCTGESIQAAINSITDASATRPYLINVAPGIYNEKLTLISHVDIAGAGIGKTVIRAAGDALKAPAAAATVTAANVTNAALRHLTIASERSGGTGDLAGLYYDGTAENAGLRLLYVEIAARTTGTAIQGNVWGIAGPAVATSGLHLDHVTVTADAATDTESSVTGIELQGSMTMVDCSVKVRSTTTGVRGAGILFTATGSPATFARSTVVVDADTIEAPRNYAFLAQGDGEITLVDCDLNTIGNSADSLHLDGSTLSITAKACRFRNRKRGEVAGIDVRAVLVGSGSLDLSHCDLISTSYALFGSDLAEYRVRAYYCRLQGLRSVGSTGSTVEFFRCVSLEWNDFPMEELHTLQP